MDDTSSSTETFDVKGEDLLTKVKDLLREGTIRRISIKSSEGKVILEIPLTFGVVGALLAPSLAAIGAVAALVTDCTIEVERIDQQDDAADGQST